MSSTRDQIIDLAEQFIRTRGYHAFSYKDISTPLQIKNAAVHYHFPSKADLGVAVIDRNTDSFSKWTQSWNKLEPTAQLDQFINIYRSSRKRNMVCFMGALGPAFDSLPEVMQHKLQAASDQIRTWLRGVIKAGREQGKFNENGTVEEHADLIVTSLLSSLILSKVSQSNATESVARAITKTI